MAILAIFVGLLAIVLGFLFFIRTKNDNTANRNGSNRQSSALRSNIPVGLQDAINAQINGLPTSDLRKLAMSAYEEAYDKAISSSGNRESSHEIGLVNVLWKRISLTDPTLVLNEQIASFLQAEVFPFSRVGPDVGKASMMEYFIWRDKRTEGDVAMIRSTLTAAQNSMSHDADAKAFWKAISSGPFEWTKLL